MQETLKYFFLNYANLALENGPNLLHYLYKDLKTDFDMMYRKSPFRIEEIILYMEKYSSYSYSEARNIIEEGDNIKTEHVRLAFDAIFGCSVIDPSKDCKDCFTGMMISNSQNFNKNPTDNREKRHTCYECTQTVFRQILAEITEGTGYREMVEWLPSLHHCL